MNPDLLAHMFSQANNEPEEAKPRPIHEAQIMEIKARYEAYRASLRPETFPFQVGDLVTPRPGSNIRCEGEPHIVVETRPDTEPYMEGADHGSPGFGARLNIRVLALAHDGETYLAWWNEAYAFEPYPVPVHE